MKSESALNRERDRKLYNIVTERIARYTYRLEFARAIGNQKSITTQEEAIEKQKRYFKDVTGVDYDRF